MVLLGGQKISVEVTALGRETNVSVLDKKGIETEKLALDSNWKPGEAVWRGTVNGERISIVLQPFTNGLALSRAGLQVKAQVFTLREAELFSLMPPEDALASHAAIICPMPGLVKAIYVRKGQDVKAGEVVAVVEAMKMENQLRSERDGIIKSVGVKVGDTLAVDAVMMEFV